MWTKSTSSNIHLLMELFEACKSHSITRIKSLLCQYTFDLNWTDNTGRTLLHVTAEHNAAEVARYLITRGANINALTYEGDTPLLLACKRGCRSSIEILLERGADMTIMNKTGLSPLFAAFECGHLKVVEMLLEQGKNLTRDYKKYYFFCGNIIHQNSRTVQGLLDFVDDIDFTHIKAERPLLFALNLYSLGIANTLIEKGATMGHLSLERRTVLLYKAIKLDNKYLAKKIMDHCNVDVNSTFCAPYDGDETPLLLAAKSNSSNLVKYLLQKGATVDCTNSKFETALHLACKYGYEACVENILAHNPKLDAIDCQCQTALFKAASSLKGSSIVYLLMKKGADPNICDLKGRTALHVACWYGDILSVKYLLMKDKIIDVNCQDFEGFTPMNFPDYSQRVRIDKMLLLLQYGGNINIYSKNGKFPGIDSRSYKLSYANYAVYTHLKKLRIMGYLVNDSTRRSNPDFFDYLYEVENDETFIWKLELEELKLTAINNHPKTTLYDLLFTSRDKMAIYVKNEVLVDVYNRCSHNFEKFYPNYGLFLNIRFKAGLQRNKLLDSAQNSLAMSLGYRIPQQCGERIFKFFKNYELQKLNENNFIEYLEIIV